MGERYVDSPFVVVLLVLLAIVVLTMLGITIFLFIKLIKVGKLIRSDLMPMQGKIAFWSAIVYGVSPLDLLPDPIYLDDIGIIVGAITYITHLAKKHHIFDQLRATRSGVRGSDYSTQRAQIESGRSDDSQ